MSQADAYPAARISDLEDMPFEALSRMHPRLCPRQVLGVRMGHRAGELLNLQVPRIDKRILAIVEMTGCFADGISVATGCWLGRRTLQVADYGKIAATFVDLDTQQAFRIWPAPCVRARAQRFCPNARDAWYAQLEAYQIMPTADLLNSCRVEVRAARLRGLATESTRVLCSDCDEEVHNQQAVVRDGLVLCLACADGPYYAPVRRSATWRSMQTRTERCDR